MSSVRFVEVARPVGWPPQQLCSIKFWTADRKCKPGTEALEVYSELKDIYVNAREPR